MTNRIEPVSIKGRNSSDFGLGLFAIALALVVGTVGLLAALFGQFPLIALTLLAIPLAIWGARKMRRVEDKVDPPQHEPSPRSSVGATNVR